MAEYIEREALLTKMKKLFSKEELKVNTSNDIARAAILLVEYEPSADVAEVRHGKLIDCIETGTSVAGVDITGLVGYQCSLCGRYEGKKEPYCNCGAKMDLGR